jgi:hypothetical protein
MRSPSPPDRQRPAAGTVYFMIGAQRSGSTLLRLMLDHHPLVSCLGEFNLAFMALNGDGSEPDRASYHERLADLREYRYAGFAIPTDLEPRDAVPALFEAMRRQDGKMKPIVGATIHFRYREALRYWPNARFIHLVRDPRDVAPSVVAMGWAATCYHGAELWEESEREVEDLARIVHPDRFERLRFEDLVCHPERELSRLCRLLGVEYDPLMLTYPQDSTYPPPDPSAAARWTARAPARDVREIEARVGARLGTHGYEASELPPLRIGALHRFGLAMRNRCGRFRWRWRTYGPRPLLAHAIARRLGLAGMAARARRRIQDIDQQNLR